MINSNEKLFEHLEARNVVDYLFFWGYEAGEKEGEVGKSCFSQWHDSPFELDGFVWPTAEHYMMAQKAIIFKDSQSLQMIKNTNSPREAKALGRMVKNFDNKIWDKHKYEVVLLANIAKFTAHPELKEFLLSTGDDIIVEASPYDRVWGIGLDQTDPRCNDPKKWMGENLLGYVLMHARELLKDD